MDTNLVVLRVPIVMLVLSLGFLVFAVVNVYGYDTKDVMLLLLALYYFSFAVGMFLYHKMLKWEFCFRNKCKIVQMINEKIKSQE